MQTCDTDTERSQQSRLQVPSTCAMLGYITSSTEWLQQHAVHLLLRRNLAHLFEDPLDLDQLKVQLRRHQLQPCMEWTARLCNVRASRAVINKHLVRPC